MPESVQNATQGRVRPRLVTPGGDKPVVPEAPQEPAKAPAKGMLAEALAAQQRQKEDPVSGVKEEAAPVAAEPRKVAINFLEDGLSFAGRIWYRGEELVLVEGQGDWEKALMPDGRVFFELDEDEQYERWGKRFFRPGKWTGLTFEQAAAEKGLSAQERDVLLELARRQAAEVQTVPRVLRARRSSPPPMIPASS